MNNMQHQAAGKMNKLGRMGEPFLFILDFDLRQPEIIPLKAVDPATIGYVIQGKSNVTDHINPRKELLFKVRPVSKEKYCRIFRMVQRHIRNGDSFLLNLTMPAHIQTNYSLEEIFFISEAKYKLWVKKHFTVFSPETFVQIKQGIIRSFPMKGTIDATLPEAEKRLLSDKKELAEHFTIVDLIRNDLSMVAEDVQVLRFRYFDRVKTHKGELLQMSSEIAGKLPKDYQNHIGDILIKLLPAGSISGAPKKKTIEIIKKAEQYNRGYYTGIFGLFDGKELDSSVMIRFMEQTEKGIIYKSGGGITANSRCEEEYRELIDKIYVPFIRNRQI